MKKIRLVLVILCLATGSAHAQWAVAGNAIVAGNFLGTTNNFDLVFKRNNVQAGLLNASSTSFGVSALNAASTGTNNSAFGLLALSANTTGSFNTASGYHALFSNKTGDYNTAMGWQALNVSISTLNSAFGVQALRNNTSGSGNTAVGVNSNFNDTSGSNNATLGYNNAPTNLSGSNNTIIGALADVTTDGLINASAIGYNSKVCSSNTMVFGDTAVKGWGFGACTSTGKAIVVGTNATNGNAAFLTTGGAWTNTSDKELKANIAAVDGKSILSKIRLLAIPRWSYKGTSEFHIGPMAQDFYAAFNVGINNTSISTIDPAGVALIGVKELAVENDSLKNTIANLQSQLDELKASLAQLKTAVGEGTSSVVALDRAALEQNEPNPYNAMTIIHYFIPASAGTAQLSLTDASGKTIKTIGLHEKGRGQVTIDARNLSSGNYFYTLLIDGRKVDSKQMILTK